MRVIRVLTPAVNT